MGSVPIAIVRHVPGEPHQSVIAPLQQPTHNHPTWPSLRFAGLCFIRHPSQLPYRVRKYGETHGTNSTTYVLSTALGMQEGQSRSNARRLPRWTSRVRVPSPALKLEAEGHVPSASALFRGGRPRSGLLRPFGIPGRFFPIHTFPKMGDDLPPSRSRSLRTPCDPPPPSSPSPPP